MSTIASLDGCGCHGDLSSCCECWSRYLFPHLFYYWSCKKDLSHLLMYGSLSVWNQSTFTFTQVFAPCSLPCFSFTLSCFHSCQLHCWVPLSTELSSFSGRLSMNYFISLHNIFCWVWGFCTKRWYLIQRPIYLLMFLLNVRLINNIT